MSGTSPGVGTDRRRVLWGYAASIGAAAGYGTGAVASRALVADHSPPMVASAFSLIFGTAMVAVLFHRNGVAALAKAGQEAWLFMSLSGVASAWGLAFLFLAFKEAPVVLVAPLSGSYPLVAIVLTHLFLQRLEKVTLRTVVGAIMVVAGVALIAATRA